MNRRQLLTLYGAGLAGLAGCNSGQRNERDTPTPEGFGSPSSPEPTLTRGAETDLRCGSGPLPGEGWPHPAGSWGRTNYAPTARGPTEKPSIVWSALPAEPENARNRFSRPLVSDGRVYVGRRLEVPTHTDEPDEQGVIAYDAASGDERWRTWLPRSPGAMTMMDDRLIVEDGSAVHGLDPNDGTVQWSAETGDGVVGLQPMPDGVLVLTSPDGDDHWLLAMGTDGAERWRLHMPETVTATPAWAAERAYLIMSGRLVAIDTTDASVAWSGFLQDDPDTLPASVIATPCATFAAIDGVLYAVNRAGGRMWSSDTGVDVLATDGDTVYGGGDGHVRAFDVEDGSMRWEASTGGNYDPDLAVDGRSVYGGWRGGALVRVATDTGRWEWAIRPDWEGPTEVVVVGSTLYAGWGRRVVAFR